MLKLYRSTYVKLCALLSRERGQDLSEYGLLVAFIALMVVIAVSLLGSSLRDFYNELVAFVESL